MKLQMVAIGNFFFKYRNKAFPAIIVALYIIAAPSTAVFGSEFLERVKDIIAVAIAVSGLLMRGLVIGYAYIKRGGMNKKVYAENLVTEGIFGICRNPLYVGNVLIYIGVFLLHGDPLVMFLGIVGFLLIYQCIILAEEAYLENKFGAGYKEYCKDVPRWIPKFSRLKEVTECMEFNIRRVILKDYTTIASTTISLTLTEAYRYLALPNRADNIGFITFLGALLVVTGICTLSMRILKKRRWLVEAPIAH